MRQRLVLVPLCLAALAFPGASAVAQNKSFELGSMRLSGATWGGATALEGSGRTVCGAGDVNDDGYDDFLVGASSWDTPSVDDVGRVFLVYGGIGVTGTHALASGGAIFQGEVSGVVGWQTGLSVCGAGDVNGDDYDDFLIGAPMAKTNGNTGSGRAYLVYGGPSITGTISLASFTGGVLINGANASDLFGAAVAGVGDINDDGFDDMLIGASGADNGATNFTGAAYLVYGGNALPAVIDIASLGAGGVAILGTATSERIGDTVAAAGDVNGDDIPDLLIGGQFSDVPGKTDAGRAWIVYGSLSLSSPLVVSALGAGGVIFNGQTGGDGFGTQVSGAGDVNGDGYDDIIVGAPLADPAVGTGNNAGRSYLVYGDPSLAASIDAGNIGGSVAGVVFTGIDGITTNSPAGDRSGIAVAAGGDINGDGYADLLIASTNGDFNGFNAAGEVYLIEGSPSLPAAFPLSAINARGTVLGGIDATDLAGTSIAFAGDINGDGMQDLLIGAPGGDPAGGTDSGETSVLYGACHLVQAIGPVAEGGMLKLRAHGTPGVANMTFATLLAVGQLPFPPQQPIATKFGPWWLISQNVLFQFAFAANGEMSLNLAMPPMGSGLVGVPVYMQTLGVPQGKKCDLTSLLCFTIE